jgi:hypothetical protein
MAGSVVQSWSYGDVRWNSSVSIFLQNVRPGHSSTVGKPQQVQYFYPIYAFDLNPLLASVIAGMPSCLTCYYVATWPANGISHYIIWNGTLTILKELKMPNFGFKIRKVKYLSSSCCFFLISWDQTTGSTFLGKDSCSWELSLSHSSALVHSSSIWQTNRSSEAE